MGSLRGWTPQPLPLSPTIPSLFLLLHIWPSSSPSYDAAKRNPQLNGNPKFQPKTKSTVINARTQGEKQDYSQKLTNKPMFSSIPKNVSQSQWRSKTLHKKKCSFQFPKQWTALELLTSFSKYLHTKLS